MLLSALARFNNNVLPFLENGFRYNRNGGIFCRDPFVEPVQDAHNLVRVQALVLAVSPGAPADLSARARDTSTLLPQCFSGMFPF